MMFRRARYLLPCAIVVALYLASGFLGSVAYGGATANVQAPNGGGDPGGAVSSFAINQTTAYPIGVTTDAKGNVWFAEDNLDTIAEFFPSNHSTITFQIPTVHHLAWIWYLIFDQQGRLWFTDEYQHLIWSFDPSTEDFANFTAGAAYPLVIHYDPARNRMWFTSLKTQQVGYFDIAGGEAVLTKVANLSAPLPGSGVSGITTDAAGDVFVAESFQAKIVELDGTTLNVIRTWSLPVESQPVGLALDPARGRLWFTNHASSFFGYVELGSTAYFEYPTSLFFTGGDYAVTLPYWIFISDSGNVWFNEHVGNRISRFDPGTLQLTEFEIPTNSSSPLMLSVDDPRGVVWFTEFSGNDLGMIDQNSSGSGPVSVGVLAATANPTATLMANPALPTTSAPVVSTTGERTGVPRPTFEVYTSLKAGVYQVELTADKATPGNYTAAVCFRYTYSNQCGYAQIEVPQGPGSFLLYAVYAAAGLGVVVLAAALLREMRRDRLRAPAPR